MNDQLAGVDTIGQADYDGGMYASFANTTGSGGAMGIGAEAKLKTGGVLARVCGNAAC